MRISALIVTGVALLVLGLWQPVAAQTTYHYDMQFGGYGAGNDQMYGPKKMNVRGDVVAVADCYNDRVVLYDLDGRYIMKLGTAGDGPDNLDDPFEADFDAAGYVYIADFYNGRIVKRTPTLGFCLAFGTEGNGRDQLLGPRATAISNTTGRIFVVDALHNRISIWNLMGVHQGNFGGTGSGPGQMLQPHDIAIGGNYLYVADSDNNRIQKFTLNGQYVTQWSAGGPKALDAPRGIAVAPNGQIFVADATNNRVVQYTANGQFLSAFADRPGDPGLGFPVGVAVDRYNRVYVADTHGNRVQRFRPNASPPVQNVTVARGFVTSATVQSAPDGTVSITAAVNGPCELKATILNMAGTRIRRLAPVTTAASSATLRWDGKNEFGNRAPGGSYVVRVESFSTDGTRTSVMTPLKLRR